MSFKLEFYLSLFEKKKKSEGLMTFQACLESCTEGNLAGTRTYCCETDNCNGSASIRHGLNYKQKLYMIIMGYIAKILFGWKGFECFIKIDSDNICLNLFLFE